MNESLDEAIYNVINEGVEDIKKIVATLKVGDKTNFGLVTKISDNAIEFKSKDLGKTNILFKQRKMGSADFILDKLVKV